ncbi:hypothetical protein V6N12_041736 [Hibiscus sabdariffa]|uniref:TATA-box-binding protein n=1 Tax=Hibiscus sabdariffa TaxID=183260 RepID=A0ABR1ZTH5_9ROSI
MAENGGLERSQPVDLSKHPSDLKVLLTPIPWCLFKYQRMVAKNFSPNCSETNNAETELSSELFSGLIYGMKQPKIVLLICASGKIVITGAKVRDETYKAFENIYPVLT